MTLIMVNQSRLDYQQFSRILENALVSSNYVRYASLFTLYFIATVRSQATRLSVRPGKRDEDMWSRKLLLNEPQFIANNGHETISFQLILVKADNLQSKSNLYYIQARVFIWPYPVYVRFFLDPS